MKGERGASPMVVEPRMLKWADKGKGKVAVTPVSSPVTDNPLLHTGQHRTLTTIMTPMQSG